MYVSGSRNHAFIHVVTREEYVEFLVLAADELEEEGEERAQARELKSTALDMLSKSPMLFTVRATGLNWPSRG